MYILQVEKDIKYDPFSFIPFSNSSYLLFFFIVMKMIKYEKVHSIGNTDRD